MIHNSLQVISHKAHRATSDKNMGDDTIKTLSFLSLSLFWALSSQAFRSRPVSGSRVSILLGDTLTHRCWQGQDSFGVFCKTRFNLTTVIRLNMKHLQTPQNNNFLIRSLEQTYIKWVCGWCPCTNSPWFTLFGCKKQRTSAWIKLKIIKQLNQYNQDKRSTSQGCAVNVTTSSCVSVC